MIYNHTNASFRVNKLTRAHSKRAARASICISLEKCDREATEKEGEREGARANEQMDKQQNAANAHVRAAIESPDTQQQ